MRGQVKWFNGKKGYGFIINPDGNDVFVHHGQLCMDGFRKLAEGDIVEFEIGTTDTNSREQAINVHPILTKQMVEDALSMDGLHLCRTENSIENAYLPWMVVDENNVIQTSEHGMSLQEVAAYAGLDIEGLANKTNNKGEEKIMVNETVKKFNERIKEETMVARDCTDIIVKMEEQFEKLKSGETDETKLIKTLLGVSDEELKNKDFGEVIESIAERWNGYSSEEKQAIESFFANPHEFSYVSALFENLNKN